MKAEQIPASALQETETLYDQGRYVTAHARAVERFGPLADWRGGAAALVFAGRLAGNVGGERLAHVLTLRAWRGLRTDPEATPADRASAALFHAFHVFGRRGPWAARRWLRRPGVAAAFEAGADAETRADVLCLHAHVAAAFRDADAAETCWQEAHALTPDRPWTWRERAALLVALDRYPEAWEAAQESLRLRAWYRPAVQQAAHILTLLGRDGEAATLLEDALDAGKGALESAAAAAQLAVVYAELQRPADALRALDLFETLSPLLEEPARRSIASRRGEARLQLNDLPGAAAAAEALAATSFFHARTAERLRDPASGSARRVALPVPFVRQHEKTCAPATLAALSHFWGRPADQAGITRQIWYGGTFDHQERFWAETHGWVAREFRADWASAVRVLDLGVPFALVTTGINSGHLQAAIGYDARRGTLIIRDPYERNQAEPLAEEFFARFAFGGPRAMALVPADDAALAGRLRALALPEAALHDAVYAMRRALAVHDRAGARGALDTLETHDPGARLTLIARRELAGYDGDDPALLAAVEGLIALFPAEGRLRLEKLYALRRLARPAEAREWLEACVADPAQSEPNLWRELAVELAADARQRPRARQLLARALFFQPTEAAHLHALADLRWDEGDFEEGAALLRLAACAATTREDFWREFFTASRHVRATDAALGLLDARFRRLGDHSAQPARTLFWAYRERSDPASAAAVLAEALRRRPDDGELLLFAATVHARDGEHARAAEYLEATRGTGRSEKSRDRFLTPLPGLRTESGFSRGSRPGLNSAAPAGAGSRPGEMEARAGAGSRLGGMEARAGAGTEREGSEARAGAETEREGSEARAGAETEREGSEAPAGAGSRPGGMAREGSAAPAGAGAGSGSSEARAGAGTEPEGSEARAGTETERVVRMHAKAAPGAFERAAAELCALRGDPAGALVHWRTVLAREPLDTGAHAAVARLLAETDERGPAAAREALDAAVARFPHSVALHELRVQWLVSDPGRGSPEHVAAVDALLAVQGTHPWAWRERALALLAHHDPDGACAALDEAERLHPLAAATHALRGRALLAQGDRAGAQASLRRALALDADLAGAAGALLDACATTPDKRAALEFVQGEIIRQSGGTGEGVPAFRAAAYPFLADGDLQGKLDAVLAARPDLGPAWSAVVWQHADAGRLDQAHARATAAAERFPLLPRAWMDLAAVEKIRGNADAQIDALLRALRPRADCGEASRQLAAAYGRAGRFADARTVLERAIAAAPLDVANRGALAQTLWQEDRAQHGARALEILVDALRREPGYDRGWNALEQYAAALGQGERLEATARLLTTTRPGEARSFLRLAQTLPGEDGAALDERLGALDRALALNPRLEAAHDLRATLLAGAQRFDEALAACAPPVYPEGARPHTLEGRAAWVVARRGDLPGARARMRTLLECQPGYEWGWRLLADWAEACNDPAEALLAAERLAFLAPHAAGPLGYLASARLQMGRRAEAKRDLAEAMRRDPAYAYAPATLLRLQTEDGELDAAEETLAFLRRHQPGSAVHQETVRLAAKRQDPARARQALAELAAVAPSPGGGDGGLSDALKIMSGAGWGGAADEVLREAMRLPAGSGHPDAGEQWVRSRAAAGAWPALAAEMKRLDFGEEKARRALSVYVEMLGAKKQGRALRKTLRRQRAVLRATDDGWGQAGYALVTCGHYKKAVDWMADWPKRRGAQGWMLFNLSVAQRALGQHAEALAVNRHALTLTPDHTRARHGAWVALEDVLSADPETVRRGAELYGETGPKAGAAAQPYPYLCALTGHVLALRGEQDRERRRGAWRAARGDLHRQRRAKEVAAMLRGSSAVRRADNRARRWMAREVGAWGTCLRLWSGSLLPRLAEGRVTRYSVRWWIVIAWAVSQLLTILVKYRH